ncbi:MAG: EAL domain-containing protein [Acetatifactor muris]|nr:EAL domain-containing protein [Acetatifactor muris]MCM1528187.1 EAL domain-containing protein [Bacteroides sp.]
MQNISFQELIDQDELQLLQNEFCRVAGVYACCLNERREALTELSNTGSGVFEGLSQDEVQALRVSPYTQRAMERVEPGSLEDVAIERFPGGRVAVLAIYVEREFLFYWLLFDCSNREEGKFAQVLDLVRDASRTFYRSKMACAVARAESGKNRSALQEMERDLRRIEATTGIVQLLDSDDPTEVVTDRWLRILGQHLQAESAELFYLNGDERTMDLITGWYGRGVLSSFDRTVGIDICTLFQTDKPLAFSSGSIPAEHMWETEYHGWSAIMVFPILQKEDHDSVVLAVAYREDRHNWETSEVKFTSDAVQLLQSILKGRNRKDSLDDSHAALEVTLENVGCAVCVTDSATDEMLFSNRRLRNTFATELQDHSFAGFVKECAAKSREGEVSEIFCEERGRWYEMSFKEISWMNGRRGTLYSFYDITDRKLYQRKIEKQAWTDFLTGLYNRMCCERDLAKQIGEAKQNGVTGALLYLDLDDFKCINDGLGHQYGDVLLKAISHSLQRVDGLEGCCYRMGGDEFVVILRPEVYRRIDDIMESVRQVFSKPWYLKDEDHYCTASMGLITFPDQGESVADLIRKADIAMYEAKKGGKNRMVRYSEKLLADSERRTDLEENMRNATEDGCGEFEVYYQPIIDIQRDEPVCIGAEALLRWNNSGQDFMAPADFIPLAEYLGLIHPIGNHVLMEACRHCRRWNKMGYPGFKVSVNLSVVQLLQNNIAEEVGAALKETGLNPSNLTLEVTESLAINDPERMKGILERIRKLGVKIALDDFGTGYSSLNHIREIPLDVIKVDQSFVKELAEDAYSRSFIRMVAELAETIDVKICVEGIEGPSQYKALQDMKVRYVQGYYFDKPMPAGQFEAKYIDNL